MPTATMTNMSPAKWRVLNALFFAGFGRKYDRTLSQIVGGQSVSVDAVCRLEADGLIVAHIDDMPFALADLAIVPPIRMLWRIDLRLTVAGDRLVTDTGANNVVCMLAQAARHTHTARHLRVEGEVDDDCLKAMEEDGLIEGLMHLPINNFRRVPDGLQIKLTRKGRAYFPR